MTITIDFNKNYLNLTYYFSNFPLDAFELRVINHG
jgi:hypothetical protein